MADDVAHKIQIAADLIDTELMRRGTPLPASECLAIARRLWDIWHDRHEIRNLAPGEVAPRWRQRYDGDPPYPNPNEWSVG